MPDILRRCGARALAIAFLPVIGLACQKAAPPSSTAAGSTQASSAAASAAEDDAALEPAPEATPLPPGLEPFLKPYTGDLDGMVKRRFIRVLTVQNPLFYFVDRGREVGIVHEFFKGFEKELNRKLGNKVVTVHVVMIPVARDQLIPRLLAGEGDVAAAAITVTPERAKQVDFTVTASGVQEVLVTGPAGTPAAAAEDLSGKSVYVRGSSSYAEHLRGLNQRFKAEGKAPVEIVDAPEVLEDGDILEMVAAGIAERTIVDKFVADLYVQVFPKLQQGFALGEPGEVGWAYRKESPKLAEALGAYVKTHGRGTLAGNVVLGKYLKTTKWIKNARSEEDRKRFLSMAEFFKKYSDRYRFDFLLMAAQGYQESGLDQQKRSHVGAIGVMQVMPTTARDKSVGIPDIDKLESNIHAGIKYNRWIADNFFGDEGISPLNRQLFAFASYNAGPGKVASLRREAKAEGLDPDVWFNNVELIAAKRIGRETVTYVSNIYKYYLAYQMMTQGAAARAEAKEAASGGL
jgi:membrane-bound lytic murein transglycosylase MltF